MGISPSCYLGDKQAVATNVGVGLLCLVLVIVSFRTATSKLLVATIILSQTTLSSCHAENRSQPRRSPLRRIDAARHPARRCARLRRTVAARFVDAGKSRGGCDDAAQSTFRHPPVPFRRAIPPRHVRSQAGSAGRNPRHVSTDCNQGGGD